MSGTTTPFGTTGLTPAVPVTFSLLPETPATGSPINLVLNSGATAAPSFVTAVEQQVAAAQTVLTQDDAVTASALGPQPPAASATVMPPALALTDNFQVIDEAAGAATQVPGVAYTGTLAGIKNEYVNINTTNLDIAAVTPNVFIKTGSGNDTLTTYAGTNDVLDGGVGSNTYNGGVGDDTFIAALSPSVVQPIDLFNNFHVGDTAIIENLDPASFKLLFGDGAYGLELAPTAITGNPTNTPAATIVVKGYSTGDIADGRLSLAFGTDATTKSPFLMIHANS